MTACVSENMFSREYACKFTIYIHMCGPPNPTTHHDTHMWGAYGIQINEHALPSSSCRMVGTIVGVYVCASPSKYRTVDAVDGGARF